MLIFVVNLVINIAQFADNYTDNNSLTNLYMKNKSKKQVESINNSSKKLLLSDVSKSVCANCLKDLTMHYLCLSCLNNRHKQTFCQRLAVGFVNLPTTFLSLKVNGL